MICCCALAGTKACDNCLNNGGFNTANIYTNTYRYTPYPSEWTTIHAPIKIKPTVQYWCGNCESILTLYQKYCHNCGKEIDWSEILKDEQ